MQHGSFASDESTPSEVLDAEIEEGPYEDGGKSTRKSATP